MLGVDETERHLYKGITNSCYQNRKYTRDKDFNVYQKVLRTVAHHWIDILKDAKDTSDEE